MIQVENLSKSYGAIDAVRNISFEVQRGEVVGFLGPNGAGKTTTMKIVTGYVNPTAGRATIAGHDVVEEPMEIRKHIGYLPENTPLYTDLTPREYLSFMADARSLPRRGRKKSIAEVAESCGISGVLRRPIGTLSKGFRQRVGLAQALLHRPDILILDEPTSGLDPNQIIEIRDLLKQVGQERTILLSSHILAEVSATCSRIIIISAGRIVFDQTWPDVEKELRSRLRSTVVRLRAPAAEADASLRSVAGVDSVMRLPDDDGLAAFRVGSAPGREIGEAVFAMAQQKRWPIAELSPEMPTLEDLFRELTTSQN